MEPQALREEALAAVATASTAAALDDVRVHYLGRKSPLKLALREVRDRETGMALNAAREAIEQAVAVRQEELERAELDEKLATERVDVTLPAELLARGAGRPLHPRRRGSLHPSTQVRRDVEDVFLGLGYEVVDDREVETTRYNFDALAFPPWHPARSPRASLFLDDETVLRTETSPAQIHKMESQRPPIYMVSIGRVYRRDTVDATHYPDLPPVRGPRRRQGHLPRRPEGDAAARHARAVRAGARGAVPHALLPVHRAVDGARRVVPDLRRHRLPDL